MDDPRSDSGQKNKGFAALHTTGLHGSFKSRSQRCHQHRYQLHAADEKPTDHSIFVRRGVGVPSRGPLHGMRLKRRLEEAGGSKHSLIPYLFPEFKFVFAHKDENDSDKEIITASYGKRTDALFAREYTKKWTIR